MFTVECRSVMFGSRFQPGQEVEAWWVLLDSAVWCGPPMVGDQCPALALASRVET